jgi:hypothetical protein
MVDDGSCTAFCADGTYRDQDGSCVACPEGTQCITVVSARAKPQQHSTVNPRNELITPSIITPHTTHLSLRQPAKSVVMSTATTLNLEGGVGALDTDAEKAAFGAGIVAAMAAGPNGLVVTVEVLRVTAAASRRLAERSLSSVVSTDGIVQVTIKAGLSVDAVKAMLGLNSFSTPELSTDIAPPDSNHRALAASSVVVDYTVTVPEKENSAVGDLNAIKNAAVSDYDAAAIATSGAGSFADSLASNLGAAMSSYASSVVSTDASFSQIVTEKMSSEQLSEPFKTVGIKPGMWRGAVDRIDGVRECKNSATAWPEACLGGTEFSAYCREGHEGPLCAVCKDAYYKDKDTKMCEECGDSGGLPEGTFTSAPFLGLYALLFLLILGMVRASTPV